MFNLAFNDYPDDAERLCAFFDQYQLQIYKYAVSIVKNDILVEDAIQNSIEILIRSFDTVRSY